MPDDLSEAAEVARKLALLGYTAAAEKHLLRLFFDYRLPEGRPYEMITDLYRSLGDQAAAAKWVEHMRTVLGESRTSTASEATR